MNQLRKAGQALRDFDDAYSEKIAKFYTDRFDKSEKKPMDMIKTTAGAMLGGGVPSTRLDNIEVTPNNGKINPTEQRIANVLNVVLPVESAIVKYALPAAGVGLAMKGAIDMANVIGQQTSTTLEPK